MWTCQAISRVGNHPTCGIGSTRSSILFEWEANFQPAQHTPRYYILTKTLVHSPCWGKRLHKWSKKLYAYHRRSFASLDIILTTSEWIALMLPKSTLLAVVARDSGFFLIKIQALIFKWKACNSANIEKWLNSNGAFNISIRQKLDDVYQNERR